MRAPEYAPSSSRTAEIGSPHSTEHPLSPQPARTPTPRTLSNQTRQSGYPPPELSPRIQAAPYRSADHSRRPSWGPLLQTSHSHATQSFPGLKPQNNMSGDESTAPPAEIVSENENLKSFAGLGAGVDHSNGYMVARASNGPPEGSKVGFSEATARAPPHSEHSLTNNENEGPNHTSERSCCGGTSSERNPDHEAEQSARSGAFSTPQSNIHHPGTRLANSIKEPHNERQYSNVPPSYPLPHMTHSHVYNMPPTYATAENPLTQSQQAFFQQHGYMHSPPASYYSHPRGIAPSAVSPPPSGVIHRCTCGPSCQCFFCMAHPYNSTTRDRVQTLAHLLPDDTEYSPKSPLQSSFFHSIDDSTTAVPGTNVMHINGILQSSDVTQSGPFDRPSFNNGTYEAMPIESGSRSPQSAISSGYLTMEYRYDPIELGGCTDSTGTCRCGDDCTCVGCFTHSGHDGQPF